ncbi:MAG TPA: HD domain-containing protein [Elusimicrobiales bacterium]|nr:HD domain-containing protein [Elusimicrobiales bacterium]
MKKKEFERLESWFGGYVDTFRERGVLPGPLEFKVAHSARVAENAALIAAGLGLDAAEAGLARAAGLLHDTGRFTQFRRFASFLDAKSLDHGAEGRRVLEEKAALLFSCAAARDRLLCAVQYHNRKAEELPAGLSPAEDSLLRLVRDADKLDIMGELVGSVETDGFRGLHAMVPDIKLTLDLTPGVLESAARGETLSIKDLFTLADIMVMVAAWFYDLNYSPARRLAAERGFLERLRRQLPASARLEVFFGGLSKAAASPGLAYRAS